MANIVSIDERDPTPIYAQLERGLRASIATGRLRPGDQLPTVRQLAGELAIAPNTIVKAYNELQRRGFVVSRPGVGTVVAEGVEEVARERRVEEVFERLRVLVRDAAALGISEDELWASLDSEFERLSQGTEEGRTAPG